MKYYFTFGSGHHTIHCESLANKYVVIEAEDEVKARREMFKYFGPKWSSVYNQEDFNKYTAQFRMEQVYPDDIELCSGIDESQYLALAKENEDLLFRLQGLEK